MAAPLSSPPSLWLGSAGWLRSEQSRPTSSPAEKPSSLRGFRAETQRPSEHSLQSGSLFAGALGVIGTAAVVAGRRRSLKAKKQKAAAVVAEAWLQQLRFSHPVLGKRSQVTRQAVGPGEAEAFAQVAANPEVIAAAPEAVAEAAAQLLKLLGPPEPASAATAAAAPAAGPEGALDAVKNFLFDPRLQWDEKGNVLLDPQGNPLPDNLWTQFVACQATLIKRIDEGVSGLGIPGSFGLSVALYTLGVRTALYPFVKSQLETTAKIQVLAPRVNELREKHKDNEERLQQEVGLLYMDLQIDPLGAVLPLLLQLPVFWGLYRGIRRLAIVEYPHLKESFLWIPSLYGPNFKPDPSFDWITQWQGPLISLQPKLMSWPDFAAYMVLPVGIFVTYRQVLKEALEDENAPKLLQFTPFLLAFLTLELPQAMGIYIATNIASSLTLTAYTKAQISSKIPGYDEFVKTGSWPPGVDPEKVLAEAFGVTRLTSEEQSLVEPLSVPEAVFAGRADFIPSLLEKGRKIDEFDDRGIPASAYTLALNNAPLLEKLLELGSDPFVVDKRGNSLLHYCSGYGRAEFLPMLLDKGLKDVLDKANEDGQSPMDVARVNLSQEKICDEVRVVIARLKEVGAKGLVTTEEDEAKYEELREQKKKEEQVNQARSALKALAMAAQKNPLPEAKSEDEEKPHEEEKLDPRVKSPIQESLDRVKHLDFESLKERLGGQMSDEQLEKLAKRLESMSPEDLASYAAGLPSVKEQVAKTAAAQATPEEPEAPAKRRESVVVD